WVSHLSSSVSTEGRWVKGVSDKGQLLGIAIVAPSEFSTSIGNDGKPYVRIRSASQVANTRFVTVLYPTDEARWNGRPDISLLGNDERVSGVRVLQNGTRDHLITHGVQGEVSIGEYTFDGQVASVNRSADGSLQRVFLGGGSSLSDNGVVLVRAPAKIQVVQVDYQGAALAVYGDNLDGVSLYGPGVDVGQVTVNGTPVAAVMQDGYVVLPSSSQPSP
ncbi:MAG TPA: hypothetical protein VHS28_02095, partial [Chloroflexota bacterium]|nr:hypothetical protein [Chloroflexota bacterium]